VPNLTNFDHFSHALALVRFPKARPFKRRKSRSKKQKKLSSKILVHQAVFTGSTEFYPARIPRAESRITPNLQ
jgi:hypothetical protein